MSGGTSREDHGATQMISLVIPVYETVESLAHLLDELDKLAPRMPDELEVVLVVDGKPEGNFEFLRQHLPGKSYRWQLLTLSRNFGAWPATYAGLHHGRGDYFAVVSADLQEPPELIIQFSEILLSGRSDIVLGRRDARADPWLSALQSHLFWSFYRKFVVSDVPDGGVDTFAFTRTVRDVLMNFKEASTSFLSLMLWIGYRRETVSYKRAPRLYGMSTWSFSRRLRQAVNSIFNFSDIPLKLLLYVGAIGVLTSVVIGSAVLYGRLVGGTHVQGYAATILALLFFGGLTSFGLGIIGQYLWLVLQNVRNRPSYLVDSISVNDAGAPEDVHASSRSS